ncbi:CBO0543 family protein [Paenibacillus thermotolerans]|uniref:CBO0543 family protein n=1 Tax=Paenibacillus thermotolerans TaxID=3027807 RepID=UPI00236772E8|nr:MULTISPECIES: CBO0543 family protein [unclassified Paenibacillus]
MTDKQKQLFEQLTEQASDVANGWSAYWKTYSNMETWQFWVILAMILVPLVALVFFMNRKRAFQIGFFGFAIHVIAIYIDLYATTHRMWEYPYKIAAFPPFSFNLDAALIPVAYMFVYQFTLKSKWKYYLYLTLISVAFAFLFKPLLSWSGLFQLLESSYFQLFILYLVGGLLGKWIADLFGVAQRHST